MIDRVIVMPQRYVMTPEQEAELREYYKPIHAANARRSKRNVAVLGLLIALNWAAWPWLMGFWEIARYWLRGHGYELSVIGSALMLLVFGIQGIVRNRRARTTGIPVTTVSKGGN